MTRLLAGLILFAGLAACGPQPEPETPAAPRQIEAVIDTELGEIRLALYADRAPITVENFLAHAAAGTYDGGSFYRAVRDDNERAGVEPMHLIQGGHSFDGLPGAPGIAHETTEMTGLSHVPGAISMGRNAPGTATTEFFIMLNDYPGLDAGPGRRNPDEAGYAVFGLVVEGMEVVEAIWGSETSLEPAPEDFQYPQFLIEPVTIRRIYRVDAE